MCVSVFLHSTPVKASPVHSLLEEGKLTQVEEKENQNVL